MKKSPPSFNEKELGKWWAGWELIDPCPKWFQSPYVPVWMCWGILTKGENQTSVALLDIRHYAKQTSRRKWHQAWANGTLAGFTVGKGSQYDQWVKTFLANSVHVGVISKSKYIVGTDAYTFLLPKCQKRFSHMSRSFSGTHKSFSHQPPWPLLSSENSKKKVENHSPI